MESGEVSEFDQDWRTVDWGGRNQMETFFRHIQIRNPEVRYLRILVHGTTGAGVSSFVNSVDSAFRHRITMRAPATPKVMPVCTKKFKSYRMRSWDGERLCFTLSDMMAMDMIHSEDVINALKGHVAEGYVFNPMSPLTPGDPDYISNPDLNDKAHALVTVLSAAKLNHVLNTEIARELKTIRQKASDLGIPHIVVLSHVDEQCLIVRKDLRAIYKSRRVKRTMQDCSHLTGIPINQIFPVKNYHNELETNNDTDVLIFHAMKQIINWANDYVDDLRPINLSGEKSPQIHPNHLTQESAEDFKEPWRKVDWNPSTLKSEMSLFRLNHQDITQFRILLQGPVGAGKTCFINSVRNIFKGRIEVRAEDERPAGKSCTKTYKTYKITDKDSVTLPFVLNDVMGLEDGEKDGIHPEDIINALHGHVKEGYTFNPVSPLTDTNPAYLHKPTPNDRVHCLVSVVSANDISRMNKEVIQKMKTVSKTAQRLGIPHVVLMTKIDADVCSLVKRDLAEVYKSSKIKKLMMECSHRLGPPLKYIFPVSNYHKEGETNVKQDVLILIALKEIAGFVTNKTKVENI